MKNNFPSIMDVYDFAMINRLDEADARQWYKMNFVERPGIDKNGVIISNWPGHCVNFCKAQAARRKEDKKNERR